MYESKSAYLSHRCFKVDVNFDNAESDSFTLGRATYVRQEDGTFSSGEDGGVATLDVGSDGEGGKTLFADFDMPHAAEYEIRNCGAGCHVIVMVHNYQKPE